jgi:hypothetical protein
MTYMWRRVWRKMWISRSRCGKEVEELAEGPSGGDERPCQGNAWKVRHKANTA